MNFDLGLIFSTTGPYAALGQAARAGAALAIADLAREGVVRITAVERDPAGRPEAYEEMSEDLLSRGRVRHIVGAITSWSRKDLIPVLERHGALLWYPCPYEGFEINDHVVYMGAAPNHHMIPLVRHLAGTGVRRAYLLGSNYVWGWETLRLAREQLALLGIEILGERYVPLGSTDCALAMQEIADGGPDVVVNSLIGPSNAAFLAQLSALESGRPLVVSCNQSEADLDTLGAHGDGLVAAGSYFEPLGPPAFRKAAQAASPNGRVSSFLATTYASVRLLAEAIAEAGTDDPRQVFRAASARPHRTVLGEIQIDPTTRHASLTPHVARISGRRFEILHSAPGPVAADPYLTQLSGAPRTLPDPRPLRIVK
jgi:branched-chain amino acid transport system substrate-binding protein